MENSTDETSASSNRELVLENETVLYLLETSRWANLLSIVGFIGVGFLLIFGLLVGTLMNNINAPVFSSFSSGLVSAFYLLLAVVYIMPVLYLFRFASRMKFAIQEMNQEALNGAFKNMKSFFRFLGIMTIAILFVYALILISVIMFSLFRSY